MTVITYSDSGMGW